MGQSTTHTRNTKTTSPKRTRQKKNNRQRYARIRDRPILKQHDYNNNNIWKSLETGGDTAIVATDYQQETKTCRNTTAGVKVIWYPRVHVQRTCTQ